MHTAVETMVDSSAAQVGILRIGWEVSKGGMGVERLLIFSHK